MRTGRDHIDGVRRESRAVGSTQSPDDLMVCSARCSSCGEELDRLAWAKAVARLKPLSAHSIPALSTPSFVDVSRSFSLFQRARAIPSYFTDNTLSRSTLSPSPSLLDVFNAAWDYAGVDSKEKYAEVTL